MRAAWEGHSTRSDHPDVAGNLNDLAILYATQGKYTEAELLNKRVGW
jgi:hypothetical protein